MEELLHRAEIIMVVLSLIVFVLLLICARQHSIIQNMQSSAEECMKLFQEYKDLVREKYGPSTYMLNRDFDHKYEIDIFKDDDDPCMKVDDIGGVLYYKTRKDMFMDNPCTKEEWEEYHKHKDFHDQYQFIIKNDD
tara:strand:+ start:350 stop:757 length:408 start_codon:yes stop_codon:yes gene_type:complete